MYSPYPKFGEKIAGVPNRVYMREVDMGNDRDLFTEEETDASIRGSHGGPL
jgi:hypothetical protein